MTQKGCETMTAKKKVYVHSATELTDAVDLAIMDWVKQQAPLAVTGAELASLVVKLRVRLQDNRFLMEDDDV